MEVLQQIEATSSLQSHLTTSSVSSSSDNPGTAQSNGSATEHCNTSTSDSLHLGDLTDHALLDLQNFDHDNVVTSDSTSLDDLILGTENNSTVVQNAISVSSSKPVSSVDLVTTSDLVTNYSQLTEPDLITSSNVVTNTMSRPATDCHQVNSTSDTGYSCQTQGPSTNVVEPVEEREESPQIDVAINNVVCTFSTRCHLNLRHIALNGMNVELKKAQGMLNMKLRTPSATASIWSSGKITVTGANSETNCKIAARRIARKLQKIGFDVKFSGFKIVNVLGTCSLPFGILLTQFSSANIGRVQYEPELHPGATYQISDIHATLKIFSTGSITITAPKVENIQIAVERVFPLVYPYKKPKRIDPKDLRYIQEEMMYDSYSETEVISENSDLDLEPGEIPSTKSYRYSNRGRKQIASYRRAVARIPTTNADDYGSSSDNDLDIDSDDSTD